MANEYLQRTPTSTGNRKVWTWSGWVKRNTPTGTRQALFAVTNNGGSIFTGLEFDTNEKLQWYEFTLTSGDTVVNTSQVFRDTGNWMHILVVFNSTASSSQDRAKIYVNGTLITSFTTDSRANININTESQINGITYPSYIGSWAVAAPTLYSRAEYTDVFFIDGQALTPDVFGFYKAGKGYISVGSTQSTDFRPGQWVPKTPRVIKTAINNSGGFGVNGFYLPMNDSNNFGADFHCEPNSIIKLQENLPQPRCRIDGVGDYTGALRADPYAANLVLALPFVSGGLSSGFGDYSAAIKGSGSAKTISNTGVSIANTAGYYGSGSYFDSGNYLSTPNVSDFQFGTGDFTMEAWAYSFSGSWSIIAAQGTTGDAGRTLFAVSNAGAVSSQIGSQNLASSTGIATSGQWNHCAFVRKNGVGTIYLNGVAVGINTVYTNSIQNTTLYVGSDQGWTNTSSKMYLQDLRIYKGVAKYKGGFDVPRPYTPVGIATWRAVPDTTANNFATWNPLDRARNTGIQTDGNLSTATNTGNYAIRSTVGVSTGKWYWEFCPTAVSITNHHGIVAVGRSMGAFYLGETLDSWGMYDSNGNKRNNGSYDSYGTGFSQYDVGMVALDKSNGKIWWGKNGTWFASGNPSNATNEAFSNINIVCSGIGTDSFVSPSQLQYNSCSYNFGQNPSFSGNTTAGTFTDTNGRGLFKYQPPSGFLALCEDNLPTPAIANPGRHFRTVLYTGDGNSGRSIVGVGFTPDLVWIKSRTVSRDHRLQDSVRGFTNVLSSNLTNVEYGTGDVSSANNEGFSLLARDNQNVSAESYVAWCWRAGAGTTSTNTNGSITSVVSVNQDAGFSIVSYTGTGSAATVGHGLGKTPKFIITKSRTTADDWFTYHSSVGNGSYVLLDSTVASTVSSTIWNNTSPTSTTFSLGTSGGANRLNDRFIAYCWAEIEGFSKAFSYVGNGSADGPMIFLGLKPALIIIKRTNDAGNWQIYDSSRMSTNPNNGVLFPNLSNVEGTGSAYDIDFLSNGFKLRSTDTDRNASGSTYVGFAWAESPFAYSNSK